MISPRVASSVSALQYPQKLSEYLAGGRAVIASDISDQPMILEKARAGFVVKDLTVQNLAEAIEQFATLSREERAKLGQNASRFAQENFSPAVYEQKLKIVYEAIFA